MAQKCCFSQEGEGDSCEFEVQWGLRVGAWQNVPPTAATVEDDGW